MTDTQARDVASGTEADAGKRLIFDRNLMICFGVTLMVVMGVTSITPVLPKVMEVFGISARQIGLLITSFTIPGVVLTPVMGVLADRFGRKRIIVPSLFLFGIAGAACCFTRDFHLLLTLRFFQGVGAAALGPLNITIIGDLFSGQRRTAALGLNASILALAVAAYPVVGGSLAIFGWYVPFFLPILAVPLGCIVLFKLGNPEPKEQQQIGEYFRAILAGIRNPQVLGLLLATVATFIILYGPFLTYLPVVLHRAFGATSFTIGCIISVASLMTAVVASQLGRLIARFSERRLFKFAFLLYAVACALMAHMDGLWWFVLPIALFGLGQGLNLPSVQSLLTSYAPMEQRGAFMAVNGMALRLGQTLGPLVMGGLYAFFGINGVFYGGSVVAVVMFVTAVILVR
ncbi:MFS transporter [Oceanidesulfovibrio marinus]|uniref:MFS transporter n=1 Tax=Oceanidesulfovibrio marinus TaxID=370038 RepID=UPI001FD37021|nr:MFS transporter [Oceanidesulfovibrio marinus]